MSCRTRALRKMLERLEGAQFYMCATGKPGVGFFATSPELYAHEVETLKYLIRKELSSRQLIQSNPSLDHLLRSSSAVLFGRTGGQQSHVQGN